MNCIADRNIMSKIPKLPREGDIIEIPLSHGFAYARLYKDCGYVFYRRRARTRPSIDTIFESGIADFVTVYEWASEKGKWPVVARIPFPTESDGFPPAVRYLRPGSSTSFIVSERGEVRPATEADRTLPIEVRLTEDELVRWLEGDHLRPAPTEGRHPDESVVENSMSVDRNDVAEQVAVEFERGIAEGKSPRKAIANVMRYFDGAMDDTDFVPQFWLALADLSLRHHCLTEKVLQKAMSVIQSGECFDVVESWDAETVAERANVRKLRNDAIRAISKRLKRS